MIGALLFLRLTSLKNRITVGAKRLRQPKYLAGALVGIAYFYYFFIRRMNMVPMGGHAGVPASYFPEESVTAIGGAVLFILILGYQAFAWISPPAQPGLRFSEAEIAFLFPAPLSRRKLIHFNLLSTQLTILISSLFLTVVFNRFGSLGGNAAVRAIGWWLILSCLSLHAMAAGLLAAHKEDGNSRNRSRALAVIAAVLFVVVAEAWRHAAPPADTLASFADYGRYVGSLVDSGRLHWILLPFRCVVAPFTAVTVKGFLFALPPAILINAALAFWVIRLEVPFEEGSIARAEKRARVRAARLSGTGTALTAAKPKARKDPFALRPQGRPEFGFLWKNLIAIQSWFNLRIAVRLLIFVLVILLLNAKHTRQVSSAGDAATIVLIVCAMVAFYALLAGPQFLRQDLRNDLVNLDILKTYPLPGRQIILGEILTPLAVLTGILWLVLLVASWAAGQLGRGGMEAVESRMVLTVAIAFLIPPVCALQLLIPNAAAILFPVWFQATRTRGGGVELMGQRLIFGFGQLFAVLLAILPAAGLAAGVFLSAKFWSHFLLPDSATNAVGILAAALAALLVVCGEVFFGLWWLGSRFEKLDVSTELR